MKQRILKKNAITKKLFIYAIIAGGFAIISSGFGMAYAQDGGISAVDDVTSLMVSFGSMIGAIGAVATAVVGIIKSSTGNAIIKENTFNQIENILSGMKATDEWIKGNIGTLKEVLEVSTEVTPGLKEKLEAHGVTIRALKDEMDEATEELNRWYQTAERLNKR